MKATAKDLLFSFAGRIPRRTFWLWGIGVGVAFCVVFGILASIFSTVPDPSTVPAGEIAQPGIAPLGMLLILLLYIPFMWISLALQVKRWHDRGKSGWWVLINFIPLVGGIWAFVECGCLRGTVGPNEFGADPT